MILLDMQDVTLGFGGPLLLDRTSFQLMQGDRVCLLGRNGEGKTTILKLLAGKIEPDKGTVSRRKGLRTAYLTQNVPGERKGSVREVITAGRPQEYQADFQVEKIAAVFQLDPNMEFNALSAGLKRRVLLARELNWEPDVLLLDEPTNHLDIDAISRLENYLMRHSMTLLCVTHDRMLIRKTANRIVELDRGGLYGWRCGYSAFLKRREEVLKAEDGAWKNFEKKLSREEMWIRQGVKARRTRNEGRVNKLKKMREELRLRRDRTGKVILAGQPVKRSSKLVINAQSVSFGYKDNIIFKKFSTVIERGDRVGIIGPNGSGKTTLLKLLLGDLSPDSGSVSHGPGLKVAYLDQLRDQLQENKTVLENVGEGRI